jgi:hypothetical protein
MQQVLSLSRWHAANDMQHCGGRAVEWEASGFHSSLAADSRRDAVTGTIW